MNRLFLVIGVLLAVGSLALADSPGGGARATKTIVDPTPRTDLARKREWVNPPSDAEMSELHRLCGMGTPALLDSLGHPTSTWPGSDWWYAWGPGGVWVGFDREGRVSRVTYDPDPPRQTGFRATPNLFP